MEFRLSAQRIGRIAGIIVAALILLHLGWLFMHFVMGHGWLGGLGPRLNIGEENSFATWYSIAQLFACAIALAAVGALVQGEAQNRRAALPWFGLAALFAFLSADEHLQLHEGTGAWLKHFGVGETSGAFAIPWVVPYLLLFLVLGIAYLKFLIALPAMTRKRFIVAAILFVGGALGMEMVAGVYVDHTNLHWSHWSGDLVFVLLATVEESLEMSGIAFFLYAIVSHMETLSTSLWIGRPEDMPPSGENSLPAS